MRFGHCPCVRRLPATSLGGLHRSTISRLVFITLFLSFVLSYLLSYVCYNGIMSPATRSLRHAPC